ncbi:fimbria/pilus outer membrane usher protein [Nocardioides sp.]|uniref:fimbria/pilus outer membrane usher protein n=1 Tax=Nocardioides sp. TaxID=35761 RepID=UPI0031FE6639
MTTTSAAAAERVLVLEVVINGRATGRVGEFTDHDGQLYATPRDLNQLGLVVPREPGEAPIALSALSHLRAEVNESKQTLLLLADDAALVPTELRAGASSRLAPLSPVAFGLLLNYDANVTFSGRGTYGGAFLDARAFGSNGVLQSSAILNVTPAPGQKGFVRLDTTFTHTQSSKMRRWRAGDVVTGALPWSRAVRLGGVQLASDFGIRPDLITYPLPVISASAAVPSTVNVLVNGIRQISESVQPGPFAVRALPIVTGAGEVAVSMRDALGRQTLITLPFYASTALLKPGLLSYTLEIGAVRENHGQSDDRYSGWAINQSSRLGLTDGLTLESHAEAAEGLALLGAGVAMRVGTLGILNVSAAGSAGRSRSSGHSSGGTISAGFQRTSPRFNFSLNGTFATIGYGDVAADYDSPVPKSTLNASLGYRMGKWGNFGIAYNHSATRRQPSSFPELLPHQDNIADRQIELITASYSARLSWGAASYATGFKNLRDNGGYGIGVGISFALGGSTHTTIDSSLDGGRLTASVNIARTPQEQGDFGYRLRYQESAFSHLSAEGEVLSSWGRVSGGIDYQPGESAGRIGARGALILVDSHVFASGWIDDSFAVVSSGDVADVPVLYENRLVGNTDSRGKLLIPSLLSYQDNRLAIDTAGLPPDVEVGQSGVLVRPPDRSGVRVKFAVRQVNAALLTLHDQNGHPILLGSVAKIAGVEDRPVGHDGETYVTGLKRTNRMEVALPDGTTCVVQFDYTLAKGDIPRIGPLRCQ